MMRRIVPLSPARWGRLFGRLNFRRVEECRVILRWLDARPGERVLDVGCGDGYYDWRIARSGAHVTGIDLHEKRLAFARRHYGGDRVEFLSLDAERADFPAGSFDKAMSLCVMEHLGDDERVLANVSRAMKPGGCLTFSADSLSNDEIAPEERERHRRRYAVNTFYTMDIVRDKLSRAGFEIEEARYILSSPYALKLVRLSWKLDDLPPVLVLLRVLGYLALGAAWKVSTAFSGRKAEERPAAKGLTLLVRARKRAA
ncbi:MAG TPA: class I SAM-dependent methyltransferase [Candidatus Latescibacteria bacterium]|nr:class I SAM-dependent methyltransferase [Candidatus Latescibacterota bacterium]